MNVRVTLNKSIKYISLISIALDYEKIVPPKEIPIIVEAFETSLRSLGKRLRKLDFQERIESFQNTPQ